MVLQPNYAKRVDNENAPPTAHVNAKTLASRLRNTLHDVSRRRRARTSGAANTPKYLAQQAKRRSTKSKSPSEPIRFTMTSIPVTPPPADVEMKDAEPLPSSSQTLPKPIPVILPRDLVRPDFCEVSKEAIRAVDPELVDTDPEYIREQLEEFGPSMLNVLSTVKASLVSSLLPKELTIVVQDLTSVLPTHMVAVYGHAPKSQPQRRTKVTLLPVHSLVFAAHCSKLPPFPPTLAPPEQKPGSQEITVPVWPLCLPSPQSYPQLAAYLYNKRTDLVLQTLLPCPPPPTLEVDPSLIVPYATKLSGTFTVHALLQHQLMVHGMWQNVCALGIFDDLLWDTLDLAWQILLTALAIATGNASLMIEQPSEGPSQSLNSA